MAPEAAVVRVGKGRDLEADVEGWEL